MAEITWKSILTKLVGGDHLSAEESEALDVSYVQNWSVLGDVVLLFRTVGAVLSHKGAY